MFAEWHDEYATLQVVGTIQNGLGNEGASDLEKCTTASSSLCVLGSPRNQVLSATPATLIVNSSLIPRPGHFPSHRLTKKRRIIVDLRSLLAPSVSVAVVSAVEPTHMEDQ
jgi:hypothetical protein